METTLAIFATGTAVLALLFPKLRERFELSRAKHRSLAGHSRMSRLAAAQVPYYEYDGVRFFDSDGAPAEVAALRYTGFARLSDLYRQRFAETARVTAGQVGASVAIAPTGGNGV